MPRIPQTDSIAELAAFWDSHDVTDFEDELVEVPEQVFVRSQQPTRAYASVHTMQKSASTKDVCHVCGSNRSENVYVEEVFKIARRYALVENIPAKRCLQCGELLFDADTTERVLSLLHNPPSPVRSVTLDVFELATA